MTRMAPVRFEVRTSFDAPPRRVWDEMIAWERHGAWIPATRIEVPAGDATAVGAEFTAFTGYGPATLVDRMRIRRCEWEAAANRGDCEVDKLGPVLCGRARFTVGPEGRGCVVTWLEDVTVPYLPAVAAPLVATISAAGFRLGMRRLAKIVAG
jgi:hypothetical protein